VFDVGKSNSKLSLWNRAGRLLESRIRANACVEGPGYAALDVAGIEDWFADTARDLVRRFPIAAIVPVAHGAALAVIDHGRLAAPPICYEDSDAPDRAARYDCLRDDFSVTGSPRLPAGLNLGAQLYRLAQSAPQLLSDSALLLPFPQYWAWRLSGVAASEITTLGCHSDLWRPFEHKFSKLAEREGWARRFAPMRGASDVLGAISPEWIERTGLPADCLVLCGVHDSNAAFFGARAYAELEGRDVTVISTGTWFIAMRAPADAPFDAARLDERRDTLVNVDVSGTPTPSARFMGGREVELLIGGGDSPLCDSDFIRSVVPRSRDVVRVGHSFILPSFVPGVGPFPDSEGKWIGPELEGAARRAAVGVYLGLVTDTVVSLIGAQDAIVVEGRFAADTTFVRMLATVRPDCDVYTAPSGDSLAFGALRLADSGIRPASALVKHEPFTEDWTDHVCRWRTLVGERARG